MKILAEKEAEEFLKKQGFKIVEEKFVKDIRELEKFIKKVGEPVVLKNPEVLHKTDKKAVYTDVTSENMEKVFNELKKQNKKGVLVQKQIKGVELLLGLKKDPSFDHVIAFGIGGIATEILKDMSFRVCPIDKNEAEKMIQEIKGYPLLTGIRGQKAVNIKKLIELIVKLSKLPEKHPEIKELDINPMIINPEKAEIVDARIILE